MEQKIQELFSNEEFVKDLFASQSFDDAQAKLEAEGVDLSSEELKKAYSLLQKKQTGELTDEDLENVAGGGVGVGLVVAGLFAAVGGAWSIPFISASC